MSSPVVGSARIEYSADLGRFAAESTAQLRAAVANMVRQFEEGMARITAAASSGGSTAGNAFQHSIVNNVQQTNTQIINIINNPTAYNAAGRRDGNAFSDGFAATAKDKMASFGRLASTALLGVGAAAVGGAAALTGFGLKGAAALETTTTAFTGLLGSATLAKQQLAELQTFAAATPFSQQDVLGMAQQYYAFADSVGLAKTDVKDYLTAIGDVGAVTGASADQIKNAGMAIGQIGSSGKVTLDNLNQISEAFPGFNAAAAIAAATGKTTAEVSKEISSGSLSATDGIHALIKGMQEFPGAAGAMQAQSETLNGVWSTFTDTIQMSLTNAFTPLVPVVKTALGQLTPVIGSTLGTVAPVIAKFVTSLAPIITPLVKVLGGAMSAVLNALGPALANLAPLVEPLGSAFVALVNAIAPLLAVGTQLIATIGAPLLGVLAQLFTALQPVFETLQNALQPAIAQLADAFKELEPAIGPIAQMLGSALAQAVTSLAPILPPLIDAGLQLAVAFIQLVDALLPVLPPVLQLFGILTQLAVTMGGSVIQVFAGFITFLANVAAPVLATMAPYIQQFANWLQEHLQPAMTAVQPAIQAVTAFLTTMGTTIGKTVIPVMVGLMETALTVFGAILDGAAKAFGWVPGVGPKLKTAAANFATFKDSAITALEGVKAAANVNVNVNTAAALQHIQDVKNQINTLVGMAAGAARAAAAANIDIGVSGRGVAGKAVGGPVEAGTTYLVGEKGPEFFTAPANGMIIPNGPTTQIMQALQQRATEPTRTVAAGNGGAVVDVKQYITQQPGEDGAALASRVGAELDWALRGTGWGNAA